MTPRPSQPEPFIRGVAYPAVGDVPYPRANPTDTARLPADVWQAATVPVGVRLEVVGDAKAIDVAYRTTTGNLGYRGDGAGISFSVWRGARRVCEEEAVLGDGLIRLSLGSGSPDEPAIIYLPEGMHPVIQSLTAVRGEIAPAPQLPSWIAYGDWTTQGWTASGPSHAWTSIVARKVGLDVINFGYAGAGRGEIVSAEHISALPAAVITVAYGASCWTRVPYSVGMVGEGFRGFLNLVRQGHPTTPIVVVSPIVRPDAEDVPNRLGASMADIRHTIETITREYIVAGDTTLSLVAGAGIIGEDHLMDGIHPGDEGHKRIASAVARAVGAALKSSQDHAAADAIKGNPVLFGVETGPELPGAVETQGATDGNHGEGATLIKHAKSGDGEHPKSDDGPTPPSGSERNGKKALREQPTDTVDESAIDNAADPVTSAEGTDHPADVVLPDRPEVLEDGAHMDGADMDGVDTAGVDTDGVDTDGVDTDGADMDGVDTAGVDTDGASTMGTDADGAITDGASTVGTDADGAITDGASTVDLDQDTGPVEAEPDDVVAVKPKRSKARTVSTRHEADFEDAGVLDGDDALLDDDRDVAAASSPR